eukprot:CAMPEP_0177548202 /NCGR_PEP_ID=MMETSP0369-20130122/64320_1 /TAXON_ID=447022 ORGANISM="Scrippsiella hangoei-like, Strain SHHI-4" /NCGR_SAMPLE_ID=MMETSP0369 /ASSEMBLY_ACC=CAM_ASM_000364 /LENGTH=227 /DNA_ID=CAMNT_0019033135 /DNA_START=66 /DNA_END=747 /DNA_ORIENTATION=-
MHGLINTRCLRPFNIVRGVSPRKHKTKKTGEARPERAVPLVVAATTCRAGVSVTVIVVVVVVTVVVELSTVLVLLVVVVCVLVLDDVRLVVERVVVVAVLVVEVVSVVEFPMVVDDVTVVVDVNVRVVLVVVTDDVLEVDEVRVLVVVVVAQHAGASMVTLQSAPEQLATEAKGTKPSPSRRHRRTHPRQVCYCMTQRSKSQHLRPNTQVQERQGNPHRQHRQPTSR